MENKFTVEVCFSPALYPFYHNDENIVVIIDILRATTSICAAFAAGAKKMIPVATIEEARKCKEQGYILAAERDGKVLDFADFGNSPFYFTPDKVKDKIIAYSTTNGTQAIMMASRAKKVLIGSFINLSTVTQYLIDNPAPVLFLCSGWKNKFNLEDTLCAGAMAKDLLSSEKFYTHCDSTHAAMDLWNIARNDLMHYLEKAAHRHRLHKLVLDDVIEYCHTPNLVKVLPAYINGFLENLITK